MAKDKQERKLSETADAQIKKSNKRSEIAVASLFVFLFDKLGDFFINSICKGFFGKIFTSYSQLQKKFENGFFSRFFSERKGIRKFLRSCRYFLAKSIDSSFFIKTNQKAVKFLTSIPLHLYGNFGIFFGIYTIVVYFLRIMLPSIDAADESFFYTGAVTIAASLPLLFSKKELAKAVEDSIITSFIFKKCFGFSDEAFKVKAAKNGLARNLLLLSGLLLGLLTFFVHPLVIILGLAFLIIATMIAASPEIGVILSILLIPFSAIAKNSTLLLAGLLLLTLFFYIIKLIRGKRIIKFEIIDIAVLIFGIMIMLCGIFSVGGEASKNAAAVSVVLLAGYFVFVNLMRTEEWIKRSVYALVSSAFIVAVIGIIEFIFGESNQSWLDLSLFSDIKSRSVSLFENPNVLATFLTLIFPFALLFIQISKRNNEKILAGLISFVILLCIIFTWSRGAWVALIISSFIFLLMCGKKMFRLLGIIALAIPIFPLVLPQSIINRFLSIVNLSDSSISYRIYTWQGTIEAIKEYYLSGIGYGTSAFQSIYPTFAYSGMESAEHSHSLILQILISMGICGLLVFGIIIFMSLQKGFEYTKKPENNSSKLYVAASISAIISALVMGAFDYIWYNYRVFYLFWIVLAIGCAFVRVGNYEQIRKEALSDEDEYNTFEQ